MGSVRLTAAAVITCACALAGCGSAHHAAFCGLVRTAGGFDPVAVVHGMSCRDGMQAVFDIERDQGGGWTCDRAMHAAYELDCRQGGEEVRILERTPVRPSVRFGVVTLANWSFRLAGRRLQAREVAAWVDLPGPPFCVPAAPREVGAWTDLPGPPFCVPAAPREALVALRLRALTPHGGCFAPR